MSGPAQRGSQSQQRVALPLHHTLPVIFGVALATGFSGAVVPGSLLAVVVRETLHRGWSAGPIMMIGHGILELAAIALLLTGLIKFARSGRVQAAIGLAGAAVLLFLGFQTLLVPGEAGAALRSAAGRSGGGWGSLIGLGALMSMANPYWWLWWATIGAAHSQWAVRRGKSGAGTYYVGHILSDVLWYSAVSIALGAGGSLLSAGALKGIYVACGIFLLALGALFAITGFKTLRGSGLRSPSPAPPEGPPDLTRD
ncbi:MAG: LysE family transporter [Armatimonadota bacterium]|nr:MAG: LysE family transporter [Armatimonadota bacterium]